MPRQWIAWNREAPQPRERKLCLVQLAARPDEGLPAAVAVGYIKRGDYSIEGRWRRLPYWVIPGIGGAVTHYRDDLPDPLNPPLWPGFCR